MIVYSHKLYDFVLSDRRFIFAFRFEAILCHYLKVKRSILQVFTIRQIDKSNALIKLQNNRSKLILTISMTIRKYFCRKLSFLITIYAVRKLIYLFLPITSF